MKIKIDETKCNLCGVCVELCPEVFQRIDDKIVALLDVQVLHDYSKCYACIGNCPEGAIEAVDNRNNI